MISSDSSRPARAVARSHTPSASRKPVVRHHLAIRILHWAGAILIIAALGMSILLMSRLPDTDPEKVASLIRHMSVGALILVLTLARRFMRRKAARPPHLSSGMAWADWFAPVAHRMLDVLVFMMIGSGIGMALRAGLPAVVMAGHGGLPANIDDVVFHTVHVVGAALMIAVLVMHAGGALYHQFILKDGLLSRMWFGAGERQS